MASTFSEDVLLLRAVLDGNIEQMLAHKFQEPLQQTVLDCEGEEATAAAAAAAADDDNTGRTPIAEDIDEVVGKKVQMTDDDLEPDTKGKTNDKGQRIN